MLPYAAVTLAGKGGAASMVLLTYMGATSTLSAEIIAVSSILSFDVYREYFKKNASDRDIIRWSHIGVVFFAAFSAGFSTMLYYVGIDLQWTLYMLGVVTCPGIFPTICTVLWRKQNKAAAILSPILGMASGLAVWLGTAAHFGGEVSVSSTGLTLPCVYGTVASCFSPIVYSVIITLFRPQDYDWSDFQKEKLSLQKLDNVNFDDTATTMAKEEFNPAITPASAERQRQQTETISSEDGTDRYHDELYVEEEAGKTWASKEYKRWTRIAAFWSLSTFLGIWVLWPLPMYGSGYVFQEKVNSAATSY